MIRVFFSLLCFNFFVVVAQAQPEPDVEIIWYEKFFQTWKPKAVDRALTQANANLVSARRAADHFREVKSLKELGLIHLTQTHVIDAAMENLLRALVLEDSLGMKQHQLFTYLALAEVFEEVGDFDRAAGYLDDALHVDEQYKSPIRLVRILNATGRVNAARGHLDEAFENYELVLKYKDVVADPSVEAKVLFQLAHLRRLQGKFEESLVKHKEALAIYRNQRDRKSEARSLNDIGELYIQMKNLDKALANHLVALDIRKSIQDKPGLAASFNNIGEIYFDQKNYSRAVANLQLGLKAAREAQDQNQIRKSAEYLYQAYKITGNFKMALAYQEELNAINEFILADKNEKQLLEAQNRFVLDKKELQIDKLESDRLIRERKIQEERLYKNILFVGVTLALIVATLIFYLYLNNKRINKTLEVANTQIHEKNVALQELNATKDKFFSIISHDLKGPLNSLTSFSGLLINHSESLSKDEIKMLAQDLDKSLKNLFALLENLLEWSRSQTGNIDFKADLFDLKEVLTANQALLSAQAGNKNIGILNNRSTGIQVMANKNAVTTVVRNLVSNAIKFTPPGGTITLDAQESGNEVLVSVTDNGVGMSQEVVQKLFRIDTKHSTKGTADEKGTGLGLILCKEFIEKNGGQIGVKSEVGKGSVFYFTLPR